MARERPERGQEYAFPRPRPNDPVLPEQADLHLRGSDRRQRAETCRSQKCDGTAENRRLPELQRPDRPSKYGCHLLPNCLSTVDEANWLFSPSKIMKAPSGVTQ